MRGGVLRCALAAGLFACSILSKETSLAMLPLIAGAFASYPQVRHIKIEDGPGRPLGRSFRVKLWPTLVFLKEGKEVARVTRPASLDEVREAFLKLGV